MGFWILFASNICAYYLLGKKKSIGFIIGFLGSALGILLFLNNIPMIIMYTTFGVLNIKNYLEWKEIRVYGINSSSK